MRLRVVTLIIGSLAMFSAAAFAGDNSSAGVQMIPVAMTSVGPADFMNASVTNVSTISMSNPVNTLQTTSPVPEFLGTLMGLFMMTWALRTRRII